MRSEVAERVGFEPTVLSHTAFRERHLQPLGHLSAREDTSGSPAALPGGLTFRSDLHAGQAIQRTAVRRAAEARMAATRRRVERGRAAWRVLRADDVAPPANLAD